MHYISVSLNIVSKQLKHLNLQNVFLYFESRIKSNNNKIYRTNTAIPITYVIPSKKLSSIIFVISDCKLRITYSKIVKNGFRWKRFIYVSCVPEREIKIYCADVQTYYFIEFSRYLLTITFITGSIIFH